MKKPIENKTALEDKVSIVYISLDRDFQKWRMKSLNLNLEQQHCYLLANPDNSSLISRFMVEAIPRYILIGKEGQVINADAPPLWSKQLQQELLQL